VNCYHHCRPRTFSPLMGTRPTSFDLDSSLLLIQHPDGATGVISWRRRRPYFASQNTLRPVNIQARTSWRVIQSNMWHTISFVVLEASEFGDFSKNSECLKQWQCYHAFTTKFGATWGCQHTKHISLKQPTKYGY
jgi:hypothetical protein